MIFGDIGRGVSIVTVVNFLFVVLVMVDNWLIYKKMGRQGWEGIVPFYNTYVLFQELYGNGWKFLLLLIPLYNIYLEIKLYLDLAKEFGQGTGFGIGLILLQPVFLTILAFGDYRFRDGLQANVQEDFVSRAADAFDSRINMNGSKRKICPQCGNPMEQSAKFCPSCGADMQQQTVKICARCRRENPCENRFCSSCGAPLA